MKFEYQFFNFIGMARQRRIEAELTDKVSDSDIVLSIMNELGKEGWDLDIHSAHKDGACYGKKVND